MVRISTHVVVMGYAFIADAVAEEYNAFFYSLVSQVHKPCMHVNMPLVYMHCINQWGSKNFFIKCIFVVKFKL